MHARYARIFSFFLQGSVEKGVLFSQFRPSLHLGISSISGSRMRVLIFSFGALMHFSLERREEAWLLQFVQMYFL